MSPSNNEVRINTKYKNLNRLGVEQQDKALFWLLWDTENINLSFLTQYHLQYNNGSKKPWCAYVLHIW